MSVVTLVGAKPCLRSNVRISLTAADRSRRRWTIDLKDLALVVDGTPQIHALACDQHNHFVEMPAIGIVKLTRAGCCPSTCPSLMEAG